MAMHSTPCHGDKVVSHTPGYQIYLSHFRMFAPKCAACQMPIAPQPVSCSAILADEGEEREWEDW